jgi:hypothetical protein
MNVSKRGRTFENGKSLSIDIRRSIINEIVLGGPGDIITGYFPGTYEAVATKFRFARSTVRKVWNRFCDEFGEN